MYFTEHIRDAMHVNQRRAPQYAEASAGASRRVSSWLLAIEGATLTLAAWFDARSWSAELEHAFVPMDGIAPVTAPPRYRSGGSVVAGMATAVRILVFWGATLLPMLAGDWGVVERISRVTLQRLEELQQAHQVHVAMVVHFVESVARAARVAEGLPGRGPGLALVGLQLYSLPVALFLDVIAWKAHRAGVGILINDLPCCLPGASGRAAQAAVWKATDQGSHFWAK